MSLMSGIIQAEKIKNKNKSCDKKIILKMTLTKCNFIATRMNYFPLVKLTKFNSEESSRKK